MENNKSEYTCEDCIWNTGTCPVCLYCVDKGKNEKPTGFESRKSLKARE